MAHFVVRFLKDILGDNGHEAEVIENQLEIDAEDEGRAEELAKQQFCQLHSTRNWSLHADRIEIKPAEFPS
ncbi:hypothetical protein LRC39_15105 [Rhodopseudomonas sp. P1]|uniref:hypothetical protein n=1 Tax=Rhodopseudomonas sp. P1 TaxID=3434357 RepID=UPI0031FE0A0A